MENSGLNFKLLNKCVSRLNVFPHTHPTARSPDRLSGASMLPAFGLASGRKARRNDRAKARHEDGTLWGINGQSNAEYSTVTTHSATHPLSAIDFWKTTEKKKNEERKKRT